MATAEEMLRTMDQEKVMKSTAIPRVTEELKKIDRRRAGAGETPRSIA